MLTENARFAIKDIYKAIDIFKLNFWLKSCCIKLAQKHDK